MESCYSLKTREDHGIVSKVDTKEIEAGNDTEALKKAETAMVEARSKGLKIKGRLIKFGDGKDQPQLLRCFH